VLVLPRPRGDADAVSLDRAAARASDVAKLRLLSDVRIAFAANALSDTHCASGYLP